MTGEIAKFSPSDAARYDDFMAATRRIYEQGILVAGRKPFLRRSSSPASFPPWSAWTPSARSRGFCGIYFKEQHVRQAFDFHSLFIGGDPFRVPAIYTALSYLQVAEGVWYAEGGVYSLVTALARLVERGGGTIRTGEAVDRHRDREAAGQRGAHRRRRAAPGRPRRLQRRRDR